MMEWDDVVAGIMPIPVKPVSNNEVEVLGMVAGKPPSIAICTEALLLWHEVALLATLTSASVVQYLEDQNEAAKIAEDVSIVFTAK